MSDNEHQLQAAINKLARAMDTMRRSFDRLNASPEHASQAFAYLQTYLEAQRAQALVAAAARAAKGTFEFGGALPPRMRLPTILQPEQIVSHLTLDAVIQPTVPVEPAPPLAPTTHPVAEQPTPAAPPRRRRAEGRLVGTEGKEIIYTTEDPRPRQPEASDPDETPHPKHGGISGAGFIDDN